MECTAAITAQNLQKSFRLSRRQQKLEKFPSATRTAVDGLSFDAQAGEVFALLGPNGAGKTTTLRMMATLIRPDGGECIIDGSSIVSAPEEVRKKIGFLTSDLKLEDFFTPNYLFDFFSDLHGVPAQTRAERKEYLFGVFGINEFAEVKVGDLSTGMRQKASIVISLVHDPGIIIFDEPTNGLDVITAKTVTDFLLSLKSQGKTVIVSTHIFSLVEKIADRVGIIIDGKMTLCAPLAEMTAEKNLEDVFFDLYVHEHGEYGEI